MEDRIGEEGKGFQYILHGLNPERILIAAEAVGLGRAALERGQRSTPRSASCSTGQIGKNQGIQHPLAEGWMELEAANLMVLQRRLRSYDQRRAVRRGGQRRQVPGGRGLLQGLPDRGADARRLWLCQGVPRGALPARSADSPHRTDQPAADPRFVAEKALGLPKSY